MLGLSAPLLLADNGPVHTGLAASADSAATVYLNPAGLTRIEEQEIEVQVLASFSESTFDISFSNVSGELSSDADGGLVIPSFFWARPFGERWAAGASITVTGGMGADYADGWVGRYFSEEWSLGYLGLTPAFGYRVTDRLSLGAAVTLNYAILNQKSAVQNLDPNFGDGSMELEADDFVLSYTASALFEASDRTRWGVAWRSETEPSLSGTPEFSNLDPMREQDLLNQGVLGTAVEIGTRMPQSVLAGMHHEFRGGSTMTLDVLWLDFSRFAFTQFSVDDDSLEGQRTEYEDILAFTVGGRLPLRQRWELRFGGMHVTAGVKDRHRTFLLRIDEIWGLGAGFRRSIGKRRAMSMNLNYYDLGDAPLETADLPLVGAVAGEYSTHRALMLDFSFRWRI